MVLERVQYCGRKVDLGVYSSEVWTSTPQSPEGGGGGGGGVVLLDSSVCIGRSVWPFEFPFPAHESRAKVQKPFINTYPTFKTWCRRKFWGESIKKRKISPSHVQLRPLYLSCGEKTSIYTLNVTFFPEIFNFQANINTVITWFILRDKQHFQLVNGIHSRGISKQGSLSSSILACGVMG